MHFRWGKKKLPEKSQILPAAATQCHNPRQTTEPQKESESAFCGARFVTADHGGIPLNFQVLCGIGPATKG